MVENLDHLEQACQSFCLQELEAPANGWLYCIGEAIALSTVIEYSVGVYGAESLPALLEGLNRYETWDLLVPAVYGVSPAEFEAGWQEYIAAHYGQ
jgi:hypothetical protein